VSSGAPGSAKADLASSFPVSLQVHPRHDPVAEEEGKNVIAVPPLVFRRVDLYPVVEAEQFLEPAPFKDQGVERAQQGPACRTPWQPGLGMKEHFTVPARHSYWLQPPGLHQMLH
jgi:hypothetical protein